jgi:hydroxymethylpyrimidine/phosphomethylpyrimidine kinase
LAERLERVTSIPIIFDPVMVATSGATLADGATIAAFERLMRRATIVTPNAPELAVLTGREVETLEQLEAAAQVLAQRIGAAVLAKGGHLAGDTLTDLLVSDGKTHRFTAERIETRQTHGTGCTLASALAVHLVRGLPLPESVVAARAFLRAALIAAPGFGGGHGPLGHHAVLPTNR